MDLSIESLRKAGGFSGGLVKKTVNFTTNEGEEISFDTWVRPLSYYDAAVSIKSVANSDDILAQRVMVSICHEDGSQVFQLSDITGLDAEGVPIKVKDPKTKKEVERGGLAYDLLLALATAVSEVSNLGKSKPRDSTKKASSGTT